MYNFKLPSPVQREDNYQFDMQDSLSFSNEYLLQKVMSIMGGGNSSVTSSATDSVIATMITGQKVVDKSTLGPPMLNLPALLNCQLSNGMGIEK